MQELNKVTKMKLIDDIATNLSNNMYKKYNFTEAFDLVCKDMSDKNLDKYKLYNIRLVPFYNFHNLSVSGIVGETKENKIEFIVNFNENEVDLFQKSFAHLTLDEIINKHSINKNINSISLQEKECEK